LNVLPFDGSFDVLVLNGSTLFKTFNHAVAGYEKEKGNGKFLQISGFRIEYNIDKPDGQKLVKLEAQTGTDDSYQSVEIDKVYSVATSDFIAGGGDGYFMLRYDSCKIMTHLL